MKKFYILALGLLLGAANVFAQDEEELDNSFEFTTADGTVVPDGTVLTVNEYKKENDEVAGERIVMHTGLYVRDNDPTKYASIEWSQHADNGAVQLCFPMNCFTLPTATGETKAGYPQNTDGTLNDLQSEWFPAAPGKATVKYTLKSYQSEGLQPGPGGFPQEIVTLIGKCSTVTVNFVYDPAGINNVNSGNVARTVYYDMAGRLVREPGKGLYVKKSTLADGTVKTQKVVLK